MREVRGETVPGALSQEGEDKREEAQAGNQRRETSCIFMAIQAIARGK